MAQNSADESLVVPRRFSTLLLPLLYVPSAYDTETIWHQRRYRLCHTLMKTNRRTILTATATPEPMTTRLYQPSPNRPRVLAPACSSYPLSLPPRDGKARGEVDEIRPPRV